MADALRLMVYDRTCAGRGWLPGLTSAWRTGGGLYRALGRLDGTFGASTWAEALDWLATFRASEGLRIAEVQYWGHGKWGSVLVAREGLDASALKEGHALRPRLEAVRERFVPGGDALVWLRTCEAFGANAGLDFAARLADFTGARVAGHTFIIDALQSGLRALRPGNTPTWSPREGILEGTPDAPKRARRSSPTAPRTITCLDGEVPSEWFD